MKKLNPTEAGVTALFVAFIGQLVAFIPQFAPEQTALLSGGSVVIAGIFALIHGFSDFGQVVADARTGKVKVTFSELENDVRTVAEDEASKIKSINPDEVAKIAEDVISGKVHVPSAAEIEELVKNEVNKILSGVSVSLSPAQVAATPVTPDAPGATPDAAEAPAPTPMVPNLPAQA